MESELERLDQIISELNRLDESALKKLLVIRGLSRELDRLEQEILDQLEAE